MVHSLGITLAQRLAPCVKTTPDKHASKMRDYN